MRLPAKFSSMGGNRKDNCLLKVAFKKQKLGNQLLAAYSPTKYLCVHLQIPSGRAGGMCS